MTIERKGPKRLVVGAHYSLKDWLAQRVTAIVVALFTLVLLVACAGWTLQILRGV